MFLESKESIFILEEASTSLFRGVYHLRWQKLEGNFKTGLVIFHTRRGIIKTSTKDVYVNFRTKGDEFSLDQLRPTDELGGLFRPQAIEIGKN